MSKKIKFKVEKDDLELMKEIYNEKLSDYNDIHYEVINGKAKCIEFDIESMISVSIIINLITEDSFEKIIDFFKTLINRKAKVKIKTKKLDASFENISQENVELIIKNLMEKEK